MRSSSSVQDTAHVVSVENWQSDGPHNSKELTAECVCIAGITDPFLKQIAKVLKKLKFAQKLHILRVLEKRAKLKRVLKCDNLHCTERLSAKAPNKG